MICIYNGVLLEKKTASNHAEFSVENPVFWNAEKPYLYTITFTYNEEVISRKIGFVTYGIGKNYEFLVNGVEVKLKGVNRHDTHHTNGWYMSDEELKNDLLLMKKLNINTIRTSHYPPTPRFLDMCHHARVGRFESNAKKEYVNYIMPQEHGNHTRTKELHIKNSLEFTAQNAFDFNVSFYDSDSLAKAMHQDELLENNYTNVRIDYKNSGVGSHSCVPELHEKYRLAEKKMDFTFYIK